MARAVRGRGGARRIGDVVTVDSADIDPPPAHASGVKGKFIEGVIKLQDRLLITLNTHEVLSTGQAANK